jgi:hypothetical protein
MELAKERAFVTSSPKQVWQSLFVRVDHEVSKIIITQCGEDVSAERVAASEKRGAAV